MKGCNVERLLCTHSTVKLPLLVEILTFLIVTLCIAYKIVFMYFNVYWSKFTYVTQIFKCHAILSTFPWWCCFKRIWRQDILAGIWGSCKEKIAFVPSVLWMHSARSQREALVPCSRHKEWEPQVVMESQSVLMPCGRVAAESTCQVCFKVAWLCTGTLQLWEQHRLFTYYLWLGRTTSDSVSYFFQ